MSAKTIIILLSFCIPILSKSQDFIINGFVTDSAKRALPYASVQIIGKGIGTMANVNGLFSLHIPPAYKADSLLISHMGYKAKQISIRDNIDLISIAIELVQDQVELPSITVRQVDALAMVKKAIENIPQNFYDKPYLSHGFYRIDTKKGEEHIMLSEAVFDITSEGYDSPKSKKFLLQKMRSIQDEKASHGIDLGLSPQGIYEFDLVDSYKESGLLSKKGLKKHQFRFEGSTTIDGIEVYQISFDQKPGLKESLYKGRIFLEVNSLAFVSVQMELSPRGIAYARYGNVATRAMLKVMALDIDVKRESISVFYQRYAGKWMLSRIRNDNLLVFNSRRRFFDFPANIRVDYIVTGIDTVNMESEGKQLTGFKMIESQSSFNDENFWRDHTIIIPDYSSDKIVADIQRRNSAYNLKQKVESRLRSYPSDPAARLDSILSFYQRMNSFNGSVLIKKGDQIVLNKGYGLADRERGNPNTDTTIFRIGSLSKSFTATLIQILATEGRLSVTDSISRFLPGYVHGNVSIEQLLTHSSGIPSYTNNADALAAIMTEKFRLGEIVTKFCSDSLEFASGSRFRYSNSGYLVLAAIIEKIEDRSFAEVLQDRIFKPLGMTRSYLGNGPRNSVGYWLDQPEPAYHTENVAGAGGISSTVVDLVKWDEAITRATLLSNSILIEMTRARTIYEDYDAGYGYGWMIDQNLFSQSKKHKIVYHPGTDFGYYSMFLRQPDSDILVIMLSNHGDFPRFDLTDLILDILNK